MWSTLDTETSMYSCNRCLPPDLWNATGGTCNECRVGDTPTLLALSSRRKTRRCDPGWQKAQLKDTPGILLRYLSFQPGQQQGSVGQSRLPQLSDRG